MVYKFFKIIFLLGIIFGSVYFSRKPLQNVWSDFMATYYPCKTEITYSIGQFDTEFGISKKDFIKNMLMAENVWEEPVNKQLFKYVEKGGAVTVNLIYDYRQGMTEKLRTLDLNIDNTQASYNSIKARYNAVRTEYANKKKSFDQIWNQYEKDRATLEKKVAGLNAQGGAKGEEYNKIIAESEALNVRSAEITKLQDSLNKQVDTINTLVVLLNKTAKTLNISVTKFNEIGEENGQEFDEALYIEEAGGNRIDVFQFNDNDKLIRVLAHELGHALGLEHNENPKAIMYRLNKNTNLTLVEDDLNALKLRCGM